MVTLATSSSKRQTNLKPTLAVNKLDDGCVPKEQRFNLAYSLQTSLEINKLLEQFFNNIQEFVEVSELVYSHPPSNIDIAVGCKAQHTITYNLANEDIKLGSVIFSRARRFGESELAALEMLIGVLFFPLRNALLYREAIESSLKDALTGIGNRTAMELCFERELKLAKRHSTSLATLIIDIDHFKEVNDTFGHQNGDITLQHVVETIKTTLRETDQLFRLGGEEFVVLLHNTGPEGANLIAERIRQNVENTPVSLKEQELPRTVSIGISIFNGEEDTELLIKRADDALYTAKENGRNRVVLWSPEESNERKLA